MTKLLAPLTLALGTALTGLNAASAAQPADRDGPFSDGVLTRAEAAQIAEAAFERQDENADGLVSEVERQAAEAAAEERREARRADRRAGRERGGRRGGGDGERFDRQDANRDGFVSRQEAVDAALARFDARDADGDAEITRQEMRASFEKRRGDAERGDRRRWR